MKPSNDRTLFDLTRGQRLRYALAIVFLAVGLFLSLQVPPISGAAIDTAVGAGERTAPAWLEWLFAHSPVGPLWVAAAALVALTALAASFQHLRARGAAIASEAIVRRVRDRLFRHLAELPRSWHEKAETGDVVQRCSSDVETLRVFLSGQVVEIGRAALLLVFVVPLMLALDPWMTLWSIALFPPIVAFALIFFRRVQGLFREADEAEGRMTTVLQENLTGIRVVRAFARQEHEAAKFGAENADFRDRTDRLFRLMSRFWALSDVLCMTQIGLVLAVGAARVANGSFTVGTLVTFLLYLKLVIWPVRHLGRVLADSGKAIVSLGRIREVLAAEPETDLGDGADAAPIAGGIEIRGLRFAFRPEEPVLRGIDLDVRPGETVALVGPPGCGKSVLLHLLLRFFDYAEGSIRIDGRELREIPRREIRARMGAVLQEPFLFSRTIEANLRVGRADATDEQMVAAANDAAIHDSIGRFEDGYATKLGERGVTLSGGQRQRMALARALLKDPDVLLLDDALSAVDTRTERRILDALEARHGRRTTILVSHRLSSVAAADRIFVLDHGRVLESGTHAALAAGSGPYRRLWRIQSALEDEIRQDLAEAGEAGRTA